MFAVWGLVTKPTSSDESLGTQIVSYSCLANSYAIGNALGDAALPLDQGETK